MAPRKKRAPKPAGEIANPPAPGASTSPQKPRATKPAARKPRTPRKPAVNKKSEVMSDEPPTIEQILAQSEMEATEVLNMESEATEVAVQLESLNVEDANIEISENVQEASEVLEVEGCDFAVECVVDEFQVAEVAEVVINDQEDDTEKPLVPEAIPEPPSLEEILSSGLASPPPPPKESPLPPAQEPPAEDREKMPQEKKPKKKSTRKPPKTTTAKKKPPSKLSDLLDKTEEVRRSSRIKSISVLKQRSKGHGLVKGKFEVESNENSNASTPEIENQTPVNEENKPVKVKSRWRRSSELEMNVLTPAAIVLETSGNTEKIEEVNDRVAAENEAEVAKRLKQFVHLKENQYLTDRLTCKEARKMTCDCFLTPEEIERGEWGCGDDCLNRLLMIECSDMCPVGDRCTNKKFQKLEFAPVKVVKTEKKGLGLEASANIPYGEFIIEYVGEVLDHDEFDIRVDNYSNGQNIHYYFMSLRADAIIDATMKGNVSRFINHSCDPNAETQKWTVNGEIRIGFFSTRTIFAGEELTFDYRFERYGKEAQKCYCEAAICRGWLGEQPEDEDEISEDEEEETEEKAPDLAEVSEKVPESTEKSEVTEEVPPVKKEKKKRSPQKKPTRDLFEDLDQLDDEIEMLVTTGLKNQAHTLKLSRLMVRAKEHGQRAKLLRVLRRGELPCRRLFLDYHGLRLMHGYMIDAQQLVKTDKKLESLRLEMLQTLATLPIPNKTMLQDSKVLPTVENWSNKEDQPVDSDSCSPPTEVSQTQEVPPVQDALNVDIKIEIKEEVPEPERMEEETPPNYTEEIIALAIKLLEEWSNLKEVFKIPKKERIEQMKEHEREANRGYIAGVGLEQDAERKNENRYRILKRYRSLEKGDNTRKNMKLDDKYNNFPRMGKFERRRMFAIQVEQREEERRRKQREMWRQHEQQCMLLGTDPRLTAPFDPNRGFQCIWNPQIGQWQNFPMPNQNMVFNPNMPPMGVPPPNPNYPYSNVPPPNPVLPLPGLAYQEDVKMEEVKFLGPIPPPAKLPPKWKCAKDKYGRPYYYHIRIRKSQWEPPPLPEPQQKEDGDDSSSVTSSSDTSSISSDTSSEDSDSEDDLDDAKLINEVRKQMEKPVRLSFPKLATSEPEPENPPEREDVVEEAEETEEKQVSVEERLKDIFTEELPAAGKKRRAGLVSEMIISPRTEEDRMQFKEDLKRFKQNKEKLRKEKEGIIHSKKHPKEKKHKTSIKLKMKEMADSNSESAKRIKETFRSLMATVVVNVLNAYRKPDCKEGRITNTEDFKHLARKLTHFVMLKEIKHIDKIEDLVCTENVKGKAKEYIRKYMSKFGENYQKRNDEPDF